MFISELYVIMKKYMLDEIDHQILDMLIDNTRVPFTDIAKKLLISAGTVHVRVKKMEDEGIIQGSTLTLGDQFYIFDIGDDANSSGNAATYNISIAPHSGDRIQGAAADIPYIIASSMGSVRLIWMGSTPQWRVFQ